MMKRTISGMIGAGSLAHNRRDFVAENVNPDRVQLNICYKNENLKEVYILKNHYILVKTKELLMAKKE